MIYFDNASTTKIDDRLLKTYESLLSRYFANASALHRLGREVNRLQDKSRDQILKTLHYPEGKVIFTSSATEANNLALIGLFLNYRSRGQEIILSPYEHPSVYRVAAYLKDTYGAVLKFCHLTPTGAIDLTHLKSLLTSKTLLVSIMAVNNEIGALNDLKAIKEVLVSFPKVIFHSDITQAIGKVELPLQAVDAFSFSAHKIYGLKGSGALVIHQRLTLAPLFYGGEQEDGLRAGTSNAPANILLAQTVRLACEAVDEHYVVVHELYQHLEMLLLKHPTLFHINSNGLFPYILNFSSLKVKASVVLNALENEDIFIGTTSSCSAKLHEPSRAIMALTGNINDANQALRVSFSPLNTIAEVDEFYERLLTIIEGAKHE